MNVKDPYETGKARPGPGRHNDAERLMLKLTKRAAASASSSK